MFFIGELEDLAAEYRATWSGLCRGNPRGTYEIGAEGLILRSDFIRYLSRLMKKEGIMFLQKETENKDFLIYIFRKDAVKVSPVRSVAEAILKFGNDPAGVPSSAINFCIAGHPHSGGQRFRDICQAYRRQWPGFMAIDTVADSHVYKGKKYFFTPQFMAWLRVNLNEIDRLANPVQARMKFKD